MTDRVSKIILRASISDFQGKMVAAGKSVSDFGDKITNQDKKSQAFRKGLSSVGDAAGKMGLVAAAGLGTMVVASAKFDSSMSKVQAATRESAAHMEQLRAAAIKAGADTAFSATEAADAITAMAKAGVSTKDILGGGLNGALSLAAAGELDVGQAAEIAATAMNQFGLAGKDIPHIADLLAAGAGKAMGEVTDLGQALKYVGPVAHQMGISIEETTGTLALLASKGILADQAGTSLRGMLTALTSPSKLAAGEMTKLGISLYDAQGKFIGFDGVAGELHRTMGNLSNSTRDVALGQIFGNEQITAARILYEGGSKAVDDWTKSTNDAGFATDNAALKMDNLAGDFEKLKGSLSTLLITGGEGSQGFLRGVTQGTEHAVNALNDLPAPAKNAAVGLLAITAVAGGSLFLGAKFLANVADARVALANLGVSAERTSAAIRGIGKVGVAAIGIEILTAGAKALGDSMMKSYPGVEQMTRSLLDLKAAGSSSDLAKQFSDVDTAIQRLTDPSTGEHIQNVAAHLITFGQSSSFEMSSARKEIDSLDASFASLVQSGSPAIAAKALSQFAQATGLTVKQQTELAGLMPQYQEALAGSANQATLAAAGADGMASATGGLTTVTGTNTTAIDANTAAIAANIKAEKERADAAVSAFDAETAYQRSLKEGADRAKEAADIRKQIAEAEKAGAKERADISRQAGESGADTSKGMSDLQHRLASARADLSHAKTDSARSNAQDSIAGIQSQISGKQTGSSRASRDAQEQIQASLDQQAKTVADLKAKLGEYTNTLDKTTVAGQKNRDVLSDMAKGYNGLSDAQKDTKGKYAEARAALIKQAELFGANKAQAKRYADQLLQIPPRVQTKLDLQAKKAAGDLAAFKLAWDGLKPKTVKLFLKRTGAAILGPGGKLDRAGGSYADGGFTGDGGKYEPAGVVHRGEFVIDAEQTMRHRALLEAIHRRAPGYATGGYVDQRAQRTQMRGYSGGGFVSGGPSVGIDYERLAGVLSGMRPLYGDVHVKDGTNFRRALQQDSIAASGGGVNF